MYKGEYSYNSDVCQTHATVSLARYSQISWNGNMVHMLQRETGKLYVLNDARSNIFWCTLQDSAS